jgi:anti-sigma B factor antagonist
MTTAPDEQSAYSRSDALTTSLVVRDNINVLAVEGTVDLATAAQFENAVTAAANGNPHALVIDLALVEFFASAGMSILVSAHQRLGAATAFGVVADGPATSRPLKLTGLDQVFGIYPTLDAALAAFV